jgi:hypothetical protein
MSRGNSSKLQKTPLGLALSESRSAIENIENENKQSGAGGDEHEPVVQAGGPVSECRITQEFSFGGP